jgi:hypothetical protein
MRGHAVFRVRCIALLLCLASAASAQIRINGGISGNVADNTGGIIPGATGGLSETIIVEGLAPVLETSNKRCIVKMGGSVL